jgi:hypothetical protein
MAVPIETEVALAGLSLGYAAAVDVLDGVAFADLFTEDGELWVPDLAGSGAPTIRRAGRDQLLAIPSGLARYQATHHAIRTATYVVTGQTATGEVDGVAHHLLATDATGPGGVDVIWYLRYVDEYVTTSVGWRISRRVLHLRAIEERSVAHLGPGRGYARPAGNDS